MSEFTIDELKAMQLQVRQGYARIEAPRFEEAIAILGALAAQEAVLRLTALASELPESQARAAIDNVAGSIAAAAGHLAAELPAIQALLPQPPAPPAEGGGE